MATMAQTCARLLGALEDLGEREAGALHEGDFSTVVELQGRAAPLVEFLGTHGPAIADHAFLTRMRAFLLRRQASGEWLAALIDQTREELRQTQASERRAARIAPVYGASVAPAARLLAVG